MSGGNAHPYRNRQIQNNDLSNTNTIPYPLDYVDFNLQTEEKFTLKD